MTFARSRSFVSLLAIPALLGARALAQNTLRVGPGRAYSTTQAAVDAAQPGDRILVDAGTYGTTQSGPAVTVPIGVSIVCDPGTVILGGVVFTGIPALQTATL